MGKYKLKKIALSIVGVAVLLCVAFPGHADTIDLTGSRSTSTGGIIATGKWDGIGNGDHGFQIAWNITQVADQFHYVYTITGVNGVDLAKDIKSFYLEVSATANESDFDNFSICPDGGEWVKTGDHPHIWVYTDYLDSYLDDKIFGMKWKWDEDKPDDLTLSFDSDRAPMWGSFYATHDHDTTAKNIGFGTTYPDQGKINYIAVPDTQVADPPSPVPEPGTLILLGSGLLGLAIACWQKKFRK